MYLIGGIGRALAAQDVCAAANQPPPTNQPKPKVERITAAGGQIAGGRLVTDFETDDFGNMVAVQAKNVQTGEEETFECDAVVSAIGITGE